MVGKDYGDQARGTGAYSGQEPTGDGPTARELGQRLSNTQAQARANTARKEKARQDAIKEDIAKRELEKLNYAPKSVFEKLGAYNNKYRQKQIQKAIRRNKYSNLKELNALKQGSRFGVIGTTIDAFNVDPETDLFDTESPREIAAQLSKMNSLTSTQSKSIGDLQQDIAMENTKNISQNDFDTYNNRNRIVTREGNPNILPQYAMMGGGADMGSVDAVEPYNNQFSYNEDAFGRGGESADVTRASYDFNEGGRAGGGIMGTRARKAFGGIMDRVTGRKAYGLGSIFKSVGKAVKGVAKAAGKVLKSDVGKMALLAAGAYYMPGYGIKATGGFGNMFAGAGSKLGPGFFSKAGSGLMGLKDSYSGMGKLGQMATMGSIGLGLSMIPGLNTAKVDQMPGGGNRGERLKNSQGGEGQQAIRDEIYEAYESGDQDRIMQLQKFYGYKLPPLNAVQNLSLPSSLPYPNYAEGGRIGFNTGKIVPPVEMPDPMERMLKNMTPEEKAKFQMMLKINAARMPEYKPDPNAIPPVEMPTYPRTNRAEGGLMNLGGMEKDYRAEGGFVPIGKQEKADDVPARLSVNEFVFTADAVRNAGSGDIDKGAEVMENMMKNLENGGRVSEESQGNTGAQNMFSVSERIGEVI